MALSITYLFGLLVDFIANSIIAIIIAVILVGIYFYFKTKKENKNIPKNIKELILEEKEIMINIEKGISVNAV